MYLSVKRVKFEASSNFGHYRKDRNFAKFWSLGEVIYMFLVHTNERYGQTIMYRISVMFRVFFLPKGQWCMSSADFNLKLLCESVSNDRPLCMSEAGVQGFSRPMWEGLLLNTIPWGWSYPPQVEFFLNLSGKTRAHDTALHASFMFHHRLFWTQNTGAACELCCMSLISKQNVNWLAKSLQINKPSN
jgi:hypothetical protein